MSERGHRIIQVRVTVVLAAIAVLLSGLAAAWAWDAKRNEQARRGDVRALLSFMGEELLAAGDPYGGGDPQISLREALGRASAVIDQRLGDRPELVGSVEEAVAEAYDGWGDYTRAMAHQSKAIDAFGGAGGGDPVAQASRLRELCQMARMAGRLPEADRACQAASAADHRASGDRSDATSVELAKLDYERGRCRAALGALRPIATDPDRMARLDARARGDAFWFLGLCASRFGDDDDALAAFDALVAHQERTVGADHPMTAWALSDQSLALLRAGRLDAAAAVLERAALVFHARLGPDHSDSLTVPYRRAALHSARGDEAAAARDFGITYRGWRDRLGTAHSWTVYAGTAEALALARSGRSTLAAERLDSVRSDAAEVIDRRPARVVDWREAWAETLWRIGRLAEADVERRAFEETARAELPPTHWRFGQSRCLEARIAADLGDASTARTAFEACRSILGVFPKGDARRRPLDEAMAAFDR